MNEWKNSVPQDGNTVHSEMQMVIVGFPQIPSRDLKFSHPVLKKVVGITKAYKDRGAKTF
jgi:hypothetical protein